jgi:hypothetical protein
VDWLQTHPTLIYAARRMGKKNAEAPATKADIQMLMEQLGTYYDKVEQRLAAHEERLKRHFDLTVETIRHDLQGANHDRLASHEDRLQRLEHHTGLVA